MAILFIALFLVWKFFLTKKEKVEIAKVERGNVREELILSGEIKAEEYAKLSFPTSGKISWVGVKEGDWVKKGQALSKLDTTYLNASYQQTLSDLRSAQANLESTYDSLQGHTSDETFAQKATRTAYEVAKDKAYDAYIKALDNLRGSTLTSPFEGLITYLAHPYTGVNISAAETQIEVINPASIYFEAAADQTEVGDLGLNQEVEIVLDAQTDITFKGKANFINFTPKSDEVGTTYRVKVKFGEQSLDLQKIRIGMSGDANFLLSQKNDVLYVPPKFVKSDALGKYLRVGAKNNKVYVEVGLEGEDRVEVNGDIKEGDIIYD